MVFKKGHKTWNKGMRGNKLSEITKKKMSKSKRGKVAWNKGLTKDTDIRMEKLSLALKGHKLSEETKKKIFKKQKGMIKKPCSLERKRKIKENAKVNPNYGMKGKKHKRETIIKIKRFRVKQTFPLKDTKIEVKVQNFLKQLKMTFFTHQYMKIKHGYQCDIFIPTQKGINQKIIIECDGCYWHGCKICSKKLNNLQKEQIEEDRLRTKELIEKGFRIIRLWEHDIKKMNLLQLKSFFCEPKAMIERRAKKSITNGGCFSSQA